MTLTSEKNVDAIIAGGGLAGIHLALAMERNGQFPLVIDDPDPSSSSRIAAGIINPITGRRFALSWLYEDLEPDFHEVYRYWEERWKVRFFEAKNIYRSVPGNKLVNDLDSKFSDPEYQKYCRKMTDEEILHLGSIVRWNSTGYVMKGFQVDTPTFLDSAISYLTARGMYLSGRYEMASCQKDQVQFSFNKYRSKKLILATGASIIHHPDFSWVRMNPNKGEILLLESPDANLSQIIKQSVFFIPVHGNKIWMGSYNSWDFMDAKPSYDGMDYLMKKASTLKHPFTVYSHLAAIRPTVEDRRPVIGPHPENNNIFLFNGFGSKGTSLIPYFAKQLTAHIDQGTDIHPEANIHRFWR